MSSNKFSNRITFLVYGTFSIHVLDTKYKYIVLYCPRETLVYGIRYGTAY